MSVATTMALLRLVHILGGVFWVGSVLIMAGFLMPTIRAVGPAAGPVMREITQVRRLPVYVMTAMVFTLLSGFALYWIASDGFQSSWLRSGAAQTFGLGAVFAVLGALLGVTMSMPAARRLGILAAAIQTAGKPPSDEQSGEIQRLQGRMARVNKVVAVLLVLATAAMAIARYVP